MGNGIFADTPPINPKVLKVLSLKEGELEDFVSTTRDGVAAAETILMG